MVRIIAIHSCHVVDVVVLHRIDELLNQALVELEAAEVLSRVLLGDSFLVGVPIDEVTSVFDQAANARSVLRCRAAHVAHIAGDNALASHSWNQSVEEEQHGGVMVHHFSNESLALLELDERVNGKLDVLFLLDVVQILAHILVE